MNFVAVKVINSVGSSIFILLFAVRVTQALRGEIVALLLAFQAGTTAFLLVFHRSAKGIGSGIHYLIAWTCVWLPLAFKTDGSVWFSIPGLLLALWSLTALGRSFSIAPEDRGIVVRGPYRFVRHPMYTGEFLSCLGLCLAASTAWNWIVLLAFAILLTSRIEAEERVLAGYVLEYASTVPWRLLPGVW